MDSITPLQFRRALVIPSANNGPQQFEAVMAPFQRKRFEAIDPALVAVARNEKPVISRFWWEATKGASKDSDLAVCILWLLAMATRPLLCQVAAADAEQAAELRKAAKSLLHLNPWLSEVIDAQNWAIENRHTGARCEIVSADASGSHGARPDVLIINELTHIQKREFCENLMDNATKVPNGLVVIATNAGFLGSWQAVWRENAISSPRWDFQQFAEPAPWLDPAEIEEAKQRNSVTRYLRLWRGIWVSLSGDALDASDIEAAIKPRLGPMIGDERDFIFVSGLDLGVKRDHAGLATIGCNLSTRRLQLAWVESWAPGADGQIDLPAVREAVYHNRLIYRTHATVYDPHQAQLMAMDLRQVGVNMVEMPFVGKNLDLMANTLLQTFRSRTIDLFDDPGLVSDLGRLMIVEKNYGYKLEASRDRLSGHADRATALAIALPMASELVGTYFEIPDEPEYLEMGMGPGPWDW